MCTISNMCWIARFLTAIMNFTKCLHILFILSLYGLDLTHHERNWKCKLASLVHKFYSTYFVRGILLFVSLWKIFLPILESVLYNETIFETYFELCLLSAQTLAIYGSFEHLQRRKLNVVKICKILRIDLPNEKLEFPSIVILTSTLVYTSINTLTLLCNVDSLICFVSNDA